MITVLNSSLFYFVAITFEVKIQNRYKLNKKHVKYASATKGYDDNAETQAMLAQTKVRHLWGFTLFI